MDCLKYTISKIATLVSATFQQLTQGFNNRKDIFVHRLLWALTPADFSEIEADNWLIRLQLGGVSKAAIGALSNDINFIYQKGVIDIVSTAAVNMIHTEVTEFSGKIEFQPSLRINVPENLYIGVESEFAGEFSVALLVSEKDIV